MKISLNNNPETLEGTSITVNQLLKLKNFTFKMLIIKINGRLIQKEDYGTATIQDGDDVTVMHLISGG
jgi:thiamine biosynthesis protein ThiS